MEKINIAELLKDCPCGMELDCTMYDNVSFVGVGNGAYPIAIKTKSGFNTTLTKYGQNVIIDDAKCVIFPKGKTTWEGFIPPCKFKDGDIIADNHNNIAIYKGKVWYNRNLADYYCGYRNSDNRFLDNPKKDGHFGSIEELHLATEEEKQKFFQAIKENGYKWNPETKVLEKLPKFKAGDVLVSENGNIVLLSHIDSENVVNYHCIIPTYGSFRIEKNTSIGVGKYYQCVLANEQQRKRMYDKIKCSGYKYNQSTNKLEKLIEPKFKVGDRIRHKNDENIINTIGCVYHDSYGLCDGHILYFKEEDKYELYPYKFDITTLVPFESRVLVRDGNTDKWKPNFWGFYNNKSDFPYECCGSPFAQCIPYNDDTKHLLGTNDDCDEFYKTWE